MGNYRWTRLLITVVFLVLCTILPANAQLDLWQESDGSIWAENPFYLWDVSHGTSLIVKTGLGSRDWRVEGYDLYRLWLGRGGGSYAIGALNMDSLSIVQFSNLGDSGFVVLSGEFSADATPESVSVKITLLSHSPAVRIDFHVGGVSTDPFPPAVGTSFSLLPGGDVSGSDRYHFSGQTGDLTWPYDSWVYYDSTSFEQIGDSGYIYLADYDLEARQGMAIVTKLSGTADAISDMNYGIAALYDNHVNGHYAEKMITLNSTQDVSLYWYFFEADSITPWLPVEEAILNGTLWSQMQADTLRIGGAACLSSLQPSQQVFPIYLDNADTIAALDIPMLYDWALDPTGIIVDSTTRLHGKSEPLSSINAGANNMRFLWSDLTGTPAGKLPPVTPATANIPIAKIIVPVSYACLEDLLQPPDTTTMIVGIDPQSLLITDKNAIGHVPIVIRDSTKVIHYRVGDADFNQLVNVSDVVFLINYIFVPGSPAPSCFGAADVDLSGVITISDAVYLINYIFSGGTVPGSSKLCGYAPPLAKDNTPREAAVAAHNVDAGAIISLSAVAETQALQLGFESSGEVSAISITCSDPRFQVFSGWVEGEYRVGVIDLTGKTTLSAGSHDLLTISYEGDGELVLNSAIVVDSDAQEMDVTISSSKNSNTLPTDFSLSQNQPNPFNPTTQISFSLPKPAEVNLTIFNILGEKVVTLTEGLRTAGAHSVTWDGRDSRGNTVASGVYFYRLDAGDFTATKKMLMMK